MKPVNTVFLISYLFTMPSLAQAYVGPGAGLSAIGSILAFLAAILLLIVGFLWYPIKRLIKGKKDDPDLNQPLTRSTSVKEVSEKEVSEMGDQ